MAQSDEFGANLSHAWRLAQHTSSALAALTPGARAMIDPADAADLAEDQAIVEYVARAICRAYCRLHKRPEWDLLTKAEQDREIDYQWNLWTHEAIAAISA